MAFDRFMIAPIQGGLQTDVKPFLIPDDAFARMDNAYIFRGRVRKRFGSTLMNGNVAQNIAQLHSRVRVQIGTTDGSGNLAFTSLPGATLQVGALFSAGDIIFTVTTVPLVVGNASTLTTDPLSIGTVRLDSVGPNVYQFRITGGNATIATTPVFWYPALPITGLVTYYNGDPAGEPVYAFDQQFSYQFTSGAWSRLGTAIWTGTDSDFFWGTTWTGALPSDKLLFVTNDISADGIKYWDGATWTNATFQITDPLGTNITLQTATMLVVFKNRLVALNTLEGGQRYENRARWGPFGNPLRANGWRQDLPSEGSGNAIDAGTNEVIVSCTFVRDRLIVFFEESTWELAFTGNQVQPFTWQKLNSNLGSDSTFSTVTLDRTATTVGNVGIHETDGRGVVRIDEKIPDSVWEVKAANGGTERIHGIYDYFAEQIYWTFPSIDTDAFSSTFPNRVLVYNNITKSWAFNNDTFTTFNYYFAESTSAVTWDALDVTWDNNEITWNSGVGQSGNQDIIAGNQQGFVVIINPFATRNAPAMQVTNVQLSGNSVLVTAINHNLNVGNFVNLDYLNGLSGSTTGSYNTTSIVSSNQFIIDAPAIKTALLAGDVYTGGGTIARVSRIDLMTKEFNFYITEDRNAYIQKVNFMVDRTDFGEISIDYMLGSSTQGNISNAINTGSLLGTSILETTPYTLYPQEQTQERLLHPVYLQANGYVIQVRIYLSDDQLANLDIARSWFQLHSMTFYATKTSSILG